MNDRESESNRDSSAKPERPRVVRPQSARMPDAPGQWYRVDPAVVAPALLSLAALVAAVAFTWWWLAAIPTIWLGSIGAQPNLNLADGFLTYLSVGAALIVLRFHPPSGHAIMLGSVAGYVFGFVEKVIRMRPGSGNDE